MTALRAVPGVILLVLLVLLACDTGQHVAPSVAPSDPFLQALAGAHGTCSMKVEADFWTYDAQVPRADVEVTRFGAGLYVLRGSDDSASVLAIVSPATLEFAWQRIIWADGSFEERPPRPPVTWDSQLRSDVGMLLERATAVCGAASIR
jgi:hypothetical protein